MVALWCVSILALVFAVVALAIAVDNSKRISWVIESFEKAISQNFKFHEDVIEYTKTQNGINDTAVKVMKDLSERINTRK
jgi:hypothetical protein